MQPQSLFVVSLPRSLSTTLYHAACRALGLVEPSWTTAGEIMNRERIGFRHRKRRPEDARFTLDGDNADEFARMTAFLDGTVARLGCGYKDVVQPFVVAEWRGLADFRVLKIRRDVAEVAYSMLKRKWHYPDRAASLYDDLPWSLVEGLVRAEEAIASLPGPTIDYQDAVASHDPLARALRALYPEIGPVPVAYIDDSFVRTRARLEAERAASGLFREIRQIVGVVRARLGLGDETGVAATELTPPEAPAAAASM